MELRLIRRWCVGESMLGELFEGAERICYTLEDRVRPGDIFEVKVPGKTAIPAGRYPVLITFSQRFQRELPILLDVPNFSGIRIHAGNTAEDTQGCILVGTAIGDVDGDGPDDVLQSRIAEANILRRIRAALDAGEPCWITIEDRFAVDPTSRA